MRDVELETGTTRKYRDWVLHRGDTVEGRLYQFVGDTQYVWADIETTVSNQTGKTTLVDIVPATQFLEMINTTNPNPKATYAELQAEIRMLKQLLCDMTHHEGAMQECSPRWIPIVARHLNNH